MGNPRRTSIDNFQIKFCGFTRVDDVRAAIDAGVDAIGINFYPSSPRFVTQPVAEKLVRAIDRQALVVGVFVNESWKVIHQITDRFTLDAIQLHGSERAQDVPDELRDMPTIKAISWRADTQSDIDMAMNWVGNPSFKSLKGLLVDAYDPIQHGGTGKSGSLGSSQP